MEECNDKLLSKKFLMCHKKLEPSLLQLNVSLLYALFADVGGKLLPGNPVKLLGLSLKNPPQTIHYISYQEPALLGILGGNTLQHSQS